LEEWIKDLKKELNNQYEIVFDKLESLKKLRGEIEQLNKPININGMQIPSYSDRLHRDIKIIFSIFYNKNIIIAWGIDHHEKAYRKIIKHTEGFIENHQKLILELSGIKTIYR